MADVLTCSEVESVRPLFVTVFDDGADRIDID